MGRLIRKSPESLLGAYGTTDNFLVRYRDFEEKFGVIRLNDALSSGQNIYDVFYSSKTFGSKWMANASCIYPYDFNYYDQPYSGICLKSYKLGSSSAPTPERNKILDTSNYLSKIKIYHVMTNDPASISASPNPCTDRFNNTCSYKFVIWLGHKQLHLNSTTYENPIISYNYTGSNANQNQLSTLKTSIGPSNAGNGNSTSNSSPYNNLDTFGFGQISVRRSRDGNQPEGSAWQLRRRQRYANSGLYKTCCSGNPSNWDHFMQENFSGSSSFLFTIPGDEDDDTDPRTWWMYGICMCDIELADNSYLELSSNSGTNHITRPLLLYVGQENPWVSSNQSYESLTGFNDYGNSSTYSTKIDYKDGLRYAYIFRQQFNRGFERDPDGTNNTIIVAGVHNNHKKIKIILHYSCTPPSSNVNCYKFRISFHYDIKYYTGSGYAHVTGDCDFTTNRIDYPYGLSNSETMVESNIWAYHKGSYPNTVTFSNVKYGIAYDTSGWNPSTPSLNKTLTISSGNPKTPTETIGTAELSVSFDFTTSGNNCSCWVF